jgi:hypothetical protein
LLDDLPSVDFDRQLEIARRVKIISAEVGDAQRLAFSEILKSNAKDAINAVALAEVFFNVVGSTLRESVNLRCYF